MNIVVDVIDPPTRALRNWTGTVHYTRDGLNAACGPLATHRSHLAPTDQPVTCATCLRRFGVLPLTPLPPVAETYAERRARERAARRAAREAQS